MGTAERISLKIQFEHLIAAIATNCPQLERLEFRLFKLFVFGRIFPMKSFQVGPR